LLSWTIWTAVSPHLIVQVSKPYAIARWPAFADVLIVQRICWASSVVQFA
jgi:hypothetical protein